MATQLRGGRAEKRDRPGGPAKRDRTPPALFLRQITAELRKVIWPTRRELRTYTIVALVFVLVMMVIATSLAYASTTLGSWASGCARACARPRRGAGAPQG